MGKNSKRPKSYYINSAKKMRRGKNELSSYMSGFLCTCSGMEKVCVKEAYNILNEYANILYGPEVIQEIQKPESEVSEPSKTKGDDDCSSDDSSDIESTLKSDVENLKKQKQEAKDSTRIRRFQQVMVHVKSCIFISSTLEDPVKLCLAIMDDIRTSKTQKTQRLVRMIPVQMTCKAFISDIEKASQELVLKHLPKGSVSFYIAFKTRNNGSIKRESILTALSDIVKEVNSEANAEYKTPDVVLNVDIVKNICCLSLLPSYLTKYCKYNLIQLAADDGSDSLDVDVKSIQKEKEIVSSNVSANCDDSEIGSSDVSAKGSSDVSDNSALREKEIDNSSGANSGEKEKIFESLDCTSNNVQKEIELDCLDANSLQKDVASIDVGANCVQEKQNV